jgi:anaerobic magnesium-protoporphyrin IX monomethyl ester cyclase
MKVLLIQGLTVHDQPPIYPLGICSIASYLPKHEVKIIDLNIEEDMNKALDDGLSFFKPDVIGLSLRNIKVALPGAHRSSYQENIDLIRKLRNIAPKDCVFIMGGAAFSLYAEYIMKNVLEIDFGVFSEGELSFPQLLDNLDKPSSVKGIYHKDNSDIVFTGFADIFDFENSLPPRRNLLDMSKYFVQPVCVGVMSKRGCAYSCVYCSDPFLLGKRIRARKANLVADEVEELVNKYGVKDIQFADQVFNMPIEHAKDICREFIKRRIKVRWGAWLSVKPISTELLKLMEEAGCSMINFSPDSASNRVLTRQDKGISEDDLINSYKLMKAVNINVDYSFMFNGPGDNFSSFLKLILFLLKAKLHLGNKMNIHANFMVPMRIYPHSRLHEIAIEEGLIQRDDDLIEPRFYNPFPLSILLGIIVKTSGFLWHLIQKFRNLCRK